MLKVGNQVAPGGTDTRFTTTEAGTLQVCVNDNNPSDNRGGYEIHFDVDELGPAPPP